MMGDRFIVLSQTNIALTCSTMVLVDRETGVNYLYVQSKWRYGGGLTPLLDADGKPVVSKEYCRK